MTTAALARIPLARLRARATALPAGALVFAVAFAARIGVVYQHGGSIFDSTSYDPSVYYAAADALLHGRLPYVDFTLLHPPGMMLALTPFALLGRLTSDQLGFLIGNVSWMALGALNAVLVVRVARALGFGSRAAVVGGLVYATCWASIRSEFTMRLEVLGNLLLLLGLLAYARSAGARSRWTAAATGAALAAAASVKIWYAVPLVIVLAWHLVEHRPRRQLGWALVGVMAAVTFVDGPFALLAGRAMLQSVVLDQLARGRRPGDSTLSRMSDLMLADVVHPHPSTLTITVALAVAIALIAAIVRAAVLIPAARLPATLLGVQVLVLLAAPAYFRFYADYAMPAFAVSVAAAASRSAPRYAALRAWLPVVVTAAVTIGLRIVHPVDLMLPAPDRALQEAVAGDRCVQSDSPMPLIALDVLSRDLSNGCPQWVDVSGRTYGPDRPRGHAGRLGDRRWQRDLLAYLRAGSAYVVVDSGREGIAPATKAQLDRGRVISAGDRLVVREVGGATLQR